MNTDPDEVIASMTGRTIVGGEVGDGGLHLMLDDGRMAIFSGMFVVGLVSVDEPTIQ